ncbi:phosphoglycerate dehydrogenase-like enzyme [Bradyrhizobium embrapense]
MSRADAGACEAAQFIATPHVGGGLTPQAIEHQSSETVRQVAKIVAGEIPVGAVNAEDWMRRPRP